MTITLDLTPEAEARILAQAQAKGIAVEEFVQAIVESAMLPEERHVPETAFLSESALAKDWLGPEEDRAWQDL